MAKKKQIFNTEHNALSAEDLKRYEAGEMTFQEMNRVERILLEQPFYADALDGFSEIKKDQISTNKNLTDLKAKLRNRTNQTFTKPAPIFTIAKIWKPVSIAATLLLIFTGTYYLMDNKQNKADKAILMKNEAVEDNLSAPVANVPIAKEDNTATSNKGANVAHIAEKRKQALKNSTQAEAIVKESEELSVAKEAIASVIANPHEADKLATDTPSPTAGVASAPIAVEKKAVADRDEAIVQSRSIGGAGRLAGAAVSGTVVDEDNAPMKDVTVNIKGNANGIRTDEEGKFSLRDARRGDIIVFNSKVMPQMEIPFNNLPNKIVYSEHNINLPSKPKVPAGSTNDSMFEKAATYAKPEFGWDAYEVYLNENTKRPPKALQMNIKGRVIVNFIINEKGELSDFTIIKSLGYGCDEEAIRLIKNGPKWFPATKEEKPVSSSKHVIVKFR